MNGSFIPTDTTTAPCRIRRSTSTTAFKHFFKKSSEFKKISDILAYNKHMNAVDTNKDFCFLTLMTECEKLPPMVYEATPTKEGKAKSKPCPRCGGTGRLSCYHYIDNGICFKCGGNGRI